MTDWPSYKRARDLAGAVFPISEAMILQLARQHGVGRKAGRCIVFSIDDVQRLYEVLPCPQNCPQAKISILNHPRYTPRNPT